MLKNNNNLSINLFNLNHIIFIKNILINNKSHFTKLLNNITSKQLKTSSIKNIFNLPFNKNLIHSLNLLPYSYLLYYFKQKKILTIKINKYYKNNTQTQIIQKIKKQLFKLYKNPKLKIKPKKLKQHNKTYYSNTAYKIINTIYNNKQTKHYINIPHHKQINNIPTN